MAKGIPSTRLQISAMETALASLEREAGVARPTAVGEQADRRGPQNALEGEPMQRRREGERAHDEQLLA